MSAHPLTLAHKQAQTALRATMVARLVLAWRALDYEQLDATYPAWEEAAVGVALSGHARSTALATSYLRALRQGVGVPGRAVVVSPPAIDESELRTKLGITTKATIKKGTVRGLGPDVAMSNGFVLASGLATRVALGGGRQTITESVKADPRARGWVRVVSGNACAFCIGLVDETHDDFAAHDHCGCTAQPDYK